MKDYTIQLDDEAAARLERLAKKLGQSPESLTTTLVRQMLEEYRENVPEDVLDALVEENRALYERLS